MKPMKKCRVVIARLNSCTQRYFNETSLHGFRYITDPKSSKFKSYFWALICVISTCLCFILIHSQFRSYYSNRITTTILTTAFPIWEVPFPTVTICNSNLVYRDKTKYFRDFLEQHVTSNETDNFFVNLSQLVLTNKFDKDTKWEEHAPIVRLLERNGYTSEKLMAALAHPCNRMINECSWNSKSVNCSDIFQLIKTNIGYCCSFNHKMVKDQSVNTEEEYFVSGVGPSFGLSAQVNAEEEEYLSPFKRSLGVDVSIHENMQYPDMAIYSTTIRPGHDVSLSVQPKITQSEDDVKGTEINTRGCAFADEIKMEWSQSYSYTTCMNECKAKEIKNLCRCIPFYYYPVRGTTRYCTFLDMGCIKRNSVRFKNSKIAYNYFRGTRSKTKASGDTLRCKCYPQCNEIAYSYQQDQQPLKISETRLQANDSILRVYFAHVSCTKLLRSVLITWELILASVGGLIGLCLGGSILSVIEFFYHIIEAVFSRYNRKEKIRAKSEKKRYQPKLYLSDFGHKQTLELFQVSNIKSRNNKNN